MVDIAWLPSTTFDHYERVRDYFKDQLYPPEAPKQVSADELLNALKGMR